MTTPSAAPAVTALMPVYNAERYVAEAIESILAQTFGDFEFLIVDDGSTDRSRSILEGFAARDARIRLISRPNTGIVGALNEGLAAARGELVARMDADDVAMPERFERQVRYLDDHPECVVVGSRVTVIDPDGDPLTVLTDMLTHEQIDRGLLAGIGAAMYHPAVMYRKSVVLGIGAYRDDLRRVGGPRPVPPPGRGRPGRQPRRAAPEVPRAPGQGQPGQGRAGWRRTAAGSCEDAHRRRGLAIPEPTWTPTETAAVRGGRRLPELGLVGADVGQRGDRPQARDGLPGPDPVLASPPGSSSIARSEDDEPRPAAAVDEPRGTGRSRWRWCRPGWPPDAFANGIIPYVANIADEMRPVGHRVTVDRRADGRGGRRGTSATPARRGGRRTWRPGPSTTWPIGRRAGLGERRQAVRALVAECRRPDRRAGAPARRDGGVVRPGPWLQRALPIPVVVRLHGPWFLNGPLRDAPDDAVFRRRVRLEKEAILAADAITAPSLDVLERTRAYYGLAAGAGRGDPPADRRWSRPRTAGGPTGRARRRSSSSAGSTATRGATW